MSIALAAAPWAPYCNVDHVRVLPSNGDMQVADVIDRIISTLQAARDSGRPYSLANLSLGRRVPILDDDPHEWTVRLDDFLSLGDLFMTIAVGNDGDEGTDLGRIQPLGDAVNAFSVGASDGHHEKAGRAFFHFRFDMSDPEKHCKRSINHALARGVGTDAQTDYAAPSSMLQGSSAS